uniref:C-factor n=1 Tax=Anas zonorhyncha TaxID=75864 RepID=A0A8B9VBZ6_9AVES
MGELRVRSVLVTGANRGIGLGLVRHLLGLPNPPEWVFAACRDPKGKQAQELQNLASKHPNLVIIPLEVTKPASIKAAAASIGERLKDSGLNLLINNAGMLVYKTLDTETQEDMAQVYATNTIGPLLLSQVRPPPQLQEHPSSSMAPSPPHPDPCGVSLQAALNMLTKCQSLGYREHGILCAVFHPGWVQTDMGNTAGDKPPVTVDESVGGMLKVMSSLSEKDTGTFLDWEGKVVPW